jgi:hypothetical protein
MSDQDPDFADEIIQDRLPEHSQPPSDRFLPWHRTRKEFVRRLQWNQLTVRMIERRWRRQLHLEETAWSLEDQPADDDTLRVPETVLLQRALNCLMIPGEDLLDIRALHRDIQPLNCAIRYLGFNESQGSDQTGTRVHVANNAVTSLDRVVRNSRVVRDRFEAIASPDSQAYRYLKEYGPYHVVNLDLCGSMFPNTASNVQGYYNALHSLCAYQFEHQTAEWLLFVTTMVEPAVVDAEWLKKLCGPTQENYHRYPEFADRLVKLVPSGVFASSESTVVLSGLTERQIVDLFGVALGKWLLSLCLSAKPQWAVAMRPSYRYSINEDKGAVMLSLAFELRPNVAPPFDAAGMSTVTVQPKKFPDERECAMKLAESVAKIRAVEDELSADPNRRQALQESHARLLESAGYDVPAYLKWLSEREKPTGE